MDNKEIRQGVSMNDKEVRRELRAAVLKGEQMVVFLSHNGERIKGVADLSNDPERIKINTEEGPVWVPISEVESVSRVIRLRIEGKTED
ncbi:hypothetical protein GCM10010912_17350 [Paenibacillus albidus]|uniref:Uncharacterized protein n=1 Tax=Paenibacillus albidus TaxID=2041023 RepID=A0A917C7K3_9BACL|nr:hypothetical protein [Paenibacillus albidus]GGF72686.1 hypothetical protein GCM10010912_17350 [Paenibacillus albidus]